MLANHLSFNLDLHLSQTPQPAECTPEQRGIHRDEVKLLVIDRQSGHMVNTQFFHIADYLQPGDLVVVNNSSTIPGRLNALHQGQPVCIHLATKLGDGEYIIERRTANGGPDRRPFAPGTELQIVHPILNETIASCRVTKRFHPNSRLWHVMTTTDLFQIASQFGTPIRYSYLTGQVDTRDYQTVFARVPGSAEMPSASRPFTRHTLRDLAMKGVQIRSLVLHTGVSSHEVETDLAHHPVLPEWYHIPEATAEAVNEAKRAKKRIIAVGTTVVRALESAALETGAVQAGSAWTTHLITPSTPPQIATGLLTGMHESQTSHLALMYAFLPPALLREVYEKAIAWGYLWHEFGDMNLIL